MEGLLRKTFWGLILGLLLFTSATVTVIHVPQDQPTIQAGIDAAVNGDTVLVAPGTYQEHIDFVGKAVLLKSISGADSTIISTSIAGQSLVKFINNEGRNSVLWGFTLRGARSVINGGGVLCGSNCSPTIRENIIIDNFANDGSGIFVSGPSSPLIVRNLILQNGDDGITCIGPTTAEIKNNTISSNEGFGILLFSGTPTIVNNIITNHAAGIANVGSSAPSVTYNDFFQNSSFNYNVPVGVGNIEVDPKFFGGSPFDFHLQSNSPCIDAGDPSTPIPPGGGSRVDMGAFEFLYAPSFYLIEPMSNTDLQIRKPTLIWSLLRSIEGVVPSSFHALVSPNSNFSNADSSPVLTDTAWNVPFKLIFGQTYYWKVIAVPDSGDTVFSEVRNFTVVQPDFEVFLPSESAQVRMRQPTFIWQKVQDTSIADSFNFYRVILSQNPGFTPADTSPVVSDTVWKVPYKLDLNQNYFWKVETVSDSGDTIYSQPSQNFTIVPASLQLATPSNFSRVLVKRPVFKWGTVRDSSIPDVFSYQLIYAKNPAFTGATSSPILADTFWQPPANLDIATFYYWKVLAYYSGAVDTVFPQQNFRFLLAPTLLNVPGDRPTIQQAIDISINGDTVLVAPGTYTQNILFKGRKIKLMSEGGPAVTTIAKLVDGFELVNFSSGEDSTTVLRGFTLTGARLVPSGSAINLRNASPIIENNYIIDNSGQTAVIWVENGSPKLRRNLIAGNSGDAAIRLFDSSAGTEVINCTISDNFGDAIRVQAGEPVKIINNIITANNGYGIRSMGGSNLNSTITYNDLFANSAGHFFAAIPGEGNLFTDPFYRGGNPFDYHLLSISPCIDSGDPAFPVPPEGGSRIDMGAFEHNTLALPGDLNLDGILSAPDVVLELNCAFLGIGDCPLTLADLNCDNSITPADVVILLNAVFLGTPPPC